MGDKSTALVMGRGEVVLPASFPGSRKACLLTDVLHVPSLAFSLISISTISKLGLHTVFDEHKVTISQKDDVILT